MKLIVPKLQVQVQVDVWPALHDLYVRTHLPEVAPSMQSIECHTTCLGFRCGQDLWRVRLCGKGKLRAYQEIGYAAKTRPEVTASAITRRGNAQGFRMYDYVAEERPELTQSVITEQKSAQNSRRLRLRGEGTPRSHAEYNYGARERQELTENAITRRRNA